jgi:hypothetical protein
MNNYNFICNIYTIRTQSEGFWVQGAKENIWTSKEEVAGGWRRLHNA